MVQSRRTPEHASKGGGNRNLFSGKKPSQKPLRQSIKGRISLGVANKKSKYSATPRGIARGVSGKVVKGAKVARAMGQLGRRMTNPKKVGKMVKNAAKGKGLVLPGSNYIGPGNPMNRKVKSKGDALAKRHDEDYDRMLKAGYSKKKVYGGFSEADKRLMKKSDVTTPEGIATYTGMKAKHMLSKTGLTGKRITQKKLEAREAGNRAKSHMAGSAMVDTRKD